MEQEESYRAGVEGGLGFNTHCIIKCLVAFCFVLFKSHQPDFDVVGPTAAWRRLTQRSGTGV